MIAMIAMSDDIESYLKKIYKIHEKESKELDNKTSDDNNEEELFDNKTSDDNNEEELLEKLKELDKKFKRLNNKEVKKDLLNL